MNCKEKWLNLLTICRKAGRLVMGFDLTKEEILKSRAEGVFLTKDVSSRTKKEISFFCTKGNIPIREADITMDDISNSVGRRAGVLAVCDKGFAKRLMELSDDRPDEQTEV